MSENLVITEEERRLLTTDGFFEAYFRYCRTSGTFREAYEQLEQAYIRITGHRKYADYRSFSVCLSRKNKRKI